MKNIKRKSTRYLFLQSAALLIITAMVGVTGGFLVGHVGNEVQVMMAILVIGLFICTFRKMTQFYDHTGRDLVQKGDPHDY